MDLGEVQEKEAAEKVPYKSPRSFHQCRPRYKSPRRNKHPKLPPSCYRKNKSRRIAEVGLEAMGLEAVGLEGEADSAKEVEAVVEDLAVEATVVVADSVVEEEVGHSLF
jgi:hypothetical protein